MQDRAEVAIEVAARDGVAAGLVVADTFTHDGLSVTEVCEAAAQDGARAGARYARLVAQHAEPATESPGESQLRWICVSRGIRLVPQFVVRDAQGIVVARADFLVDGSDVLVEFDGLGKYTNVETLRAEKRRQVALERLGYVVLRFVHADLAHLDRISKAVTAAVRSQAWRGA